jgi:hypothetical protein
MRGHHTSSNTAFTLRASAPVSDLGEIILKSRLIHVDSIYLAVNNREESMEWFKKHFELEQDDDNRLKIRIVEVFS